MILHVIFANQIDRCTAPGMVIATNISIEEIKAIIAKREAEQKTEACATIENSKFAH